MESVLHLQISCSFCGTGLPERSVRPPRLKSVKFARGVTVRCASKRSGNSSVSSRRPASSTGGFGAKNSAKPSFDGGVLLKRSEQLYSKLIADYASEGELREFIVCVRQKSDGNGKAVLDDWLPVAELALVSEHEASVVLPRTLPVLCREVAECASKGAVSLRSISRNSLEYAYEPADAFWEHVMSGSQMQFSSSECPYEVLGLLRGAAASEVRAAYRSLAARNHPDKFVGAAATKAEETFIKVTNAYDQIKRAGLAAGGIPTYASLGGTGRNSLSEPISVTSGNMSVPIPQGVQVAVRQLEPEITLTFSHPYFCPSHRPLILSQQTPESPVKLKIVIWR